MVGTKKLIAGVVVSVGLALLGGSFMGCKPKAKKPLGEACSNDTDCESLECSPYGSICSKDCTYDKDCGGDLVCRYKDDGNGSFCSKAVGNPPMGSCMQPSECANALCLHKVGQEDQPGICSRNCQTGDDCIAGMKICDSISDSGALKVCLPGDPAGPASARPSFAPPKKPTKIAVTATPTATTPPKPTVTLAPPNTAAPTATATAKASAGPLKPPPPPPKKGH